MGSKEKILEAAIEVFAEKGRFGARMEGIASRAGVNKAMLYYYYTSRDNLYREVLRSILAGNFKRIFAPLRRSSYRKADPAEEVRRLSKAYFRVFSRNPSHTRILIEALAGEPSVIREIVHQLKAEPDIVDPDLVLRILREGVARGDFRNIEPRQIVISLIGMNLIYFLAGPVAEVLLDLDADEAASFRKGRKESIVELLLYGIMATGKGRNSDRS
jgi:TetR/AcrR family transcriptional regulator